MISMIVLWENWGSLYRGKRPKCRAITCMHRLPLPWPVDPMALSTIQLRPDAVQDGDVGSYKALNLDCLAALQVGALEINLSSKLVRRFPTQSISHKSALNSKHDMPEQCDLTAGGNPTAYPSRRRAVRSQKPRVRGPAFSRIDVKRPARDVADHDLRRELVVYDDGDLWRSVSHQQGDEGA